MSRTRKAITSAGFTYLQYTLGIVAGIVLVPLIIRSLGQRTYGLWLACGEMIAYLALADLGVFAVMPWIVAGADGRGDRAALRNLLVNGLVVGMIVGVAILVGTAAIWLGASNWLDLTPADRAALAGPLILLAVTAAVAYPLRVFNTMLGGLQDVTFLGWLSVAQVLMTIALTVALLLSGAGAYALAAAAGVPVLASGIIAAWRVRRTAPDLLKDLPRPRFGGIVSLIRESVGGWLGGFGVRLIAASNGLVLVAVGRPEWVPVYICTAKVGQLLQQMCWTLPDSSLVGLGQLHAEGRAERTREIVGIIIDLHMLLIGSVACGLLAFNPTFVRVWVGWELYGGHVLNAWLVAGIVISTLVHAVVTPVAVVGHRLQIGMATILNGVLNVALALWLVVSIGLLGLAIALVLSSLSTTLVWGVLLLRSQFGVGIAEIWRRHIQPWLIRVGPVLAVAGWAGPQLAVAPFWLSLAVTSSAAAVYIWWVRPLWARLPLPPRLATWLSSPDLGFLKASLPQVWRQRQ